MRLLSGFINLIRRPFQRVRQPGEPGFDIKEQNSRGGQIIWTNRPSLLNRKDRGNE